MEIAFYAPMKPPDDPKPSGDRQIARLLIKALERSGHRITLASHFRSWVRSPEDGAQHEMARMARQEVDAVMARLAGNRRPEIWITYHLYHKAPDWIGPAVADRLGIPYLLIEASRAPKRRTGPWAFGFAAADAALRRADAVVALHGDDAEGLAGVVAPAKLHRLAPFIETAPFTAVADHRGSGGATPVLVTVAMMRAGDKDSSYGVLAEALDRLRHLPWRHVIAGDGPLRDTILSRFDGKRTEAIGLVAPEDIPAVYAEGDIFVWPAIREAFGMVFLEAQAAGLAVIAGRSGGVPEIVEHGKTGLIVPIGDAGAFAEALGTLLSDHQRRAAMGAAAARHALENHDISKARATLDALLDTALAAFEAR